MDTIYSLLKRAKELKEKSQVDSITPEEVGKLHEDTLAYIASLEQSTDGLGIKKVYQSKSAMEADTDPVGTNGKTLRYGQLVSIYDDAHADSSENGNIYAYQKPGWLLMGKVSGGTTLSITQELGDSATKVMSQAAVTAAIGSSKKDATNTRFEDKQNLLGASNVQDAIEKISPYKIYELDTLGVYDASQVNSLRNRFAFGYNKTFDRDVRLTKIAFSDGTDANGISAIFICSADREENTVTVEKEITEFKVEGATLICNIVVPAGKIAVIKHNNLVRAYQGEKVDALNFNYKNNNVQALIWCKEDSINVSFTFSEVVNILDKMTDENGSKDAKNLRVLHNEWQGKHVAFLGDSLTADGRYCEFLCDKLGMTYEKYGVSNTEWIHFAQQAIEAYSYQLSKGFVYDAVFVFGGVNNYDHGATINGKWFTETSEIITNEITFTSKKRTPIKNGAGSIEGHVNWTLEVLKVCFPNSQIIVMTPTHKGLYVNRAVRSGQNELYSNANGVFLDQIVEKIKEGARLWGCPVIDLFSLNGAYPVLSSYDSYVRNKENDHLHHSNLGNYRIAMTIAAAMKSISPEVYDSQYDELNHTVSGTVTRGAEPLKDVNITITIGKKTFTGLTDNTGRFSVQNITPGIGELILSKGGLTLHKQAITTTYDIIHRQLDISKVDIPDMNINI
ncbi:MAG: hypothetical protein HXO30_04340 [Prevotella sp.]|nr:hypothetical protein [Prevotella sp.]